MKQKKVCISCFRFLLAFSILLFSIPVNAQQKSIKGTVVDASGLPVIGANITLSGNKSVGSITDINGEFELSVPENSVLEISFIGYKNQTLKINDKDFYKITLQEDAERLEEVVVVGYGTQKKVNLTGAISVISNEELQMTKTQDAKNMLTGKIPGVRIVQNTSEPGDFTGNFDIRGYGSAPLIVVDGVPRGNFERINPNEIESITVLKDASAAIYGVRAANGVVLITTKKGDKEGKAKIEYNMYYGIQTPAEVLRPVGSIERMTLFNEKSMRSLTDPRLTYDAAAFEPYLNGEKFSTDWYDAVMASSAPQQQHNVSISGGTSKIDYYINMGYMDQKGFFKSNSLDYNRYNFRANLNAQITDNLKMSVKLGATLDHRKRPYLDTWEIFKALWRSVPDETVYANNNPMYLSKPSADIMNPVGTMDSDISGYRKNNNKILSSTFEAEYSVPWVKGLKIKGLFSYDNTIADNEDWRLSYNEYTYDEASDTYSSSARQNPTNLMRYYGNSWSTLWQGAMSYENTFNNHHVSGLLLYEESHSKGDNIQAMRDFSLPLPYLFAGNAANQVGTSNAKGLTEVATRALVGRFNYDYQGKYMAEFLFRYDGSSKFPSNSRWGFFPSASIGWRIAEESFIKDNVNFVDNLKIRASYGKLGDDGAADYQFLTGYDYPNTAGAPFNNIPVGYVFGGNVYNTLGFRSVPNPYITWYTIKTLNVGLDVDLWKGLLGVTFEVFQRDRDGLLANRLSTVPGNFGANLPQENLNSDRTKGIELELRHHNKIGNFHYNVSGNVSITRTMFMDIVRNPSGNSYANWRDRNNTNRYNDIWFGYGAGGRYTNYDDIANSEVFTGNATLPGDYYYEDWNNDGIIDDMDRYPIATTANAGASNWQDKQNYPLMNFGLNLGGGWNGIDFNLSFQGAAMSYVSYGEQLSSPLQFQGNALEMFMDRWHPEDPKADPYDPATEWISGYYSYGGTTPDQNSEFAIQKGNYLRLKTAEIGYTFPKQWLSFVSVQNFRIYVNAYNLFTITGVKGVDPEKPSQKYGYMYPLNRSYNFGVSITF